MKRLLLFVLTLTILQGCKKSEPEPVPTVQTEGLDIKYDQTKQLEVKLGNEVLDPKSFFWKIDDETVGSIDNLGVFTAQKVGIANISIFNSDGTKVSESTITVSPYSTLFQEPITSWGTPLQNIIKDEKRKLADRQTYRLQFEGENQQVRAVAYELTLEKTLGFSILQLKDTPETRLEVMTFLKERYQYVHDPDNVSEGENFINYERTKLVTLIDEKFLGLSVIYTPYDNVL
ncbi:Ig-like domain-containing protein [Dyadobacter fermentans]|nr:Ig-like domain-containing protein [Dyadobacter fermentans]